MTRCLSVMFMLVEDASLRDWNEPGGGSPSFRCQLPGSSVTREMRFPMTSTNVLSDTRAEDVRHSEREGYTRTQHTRAPWDGDGDAPRREDDTRFSRAMQRRATADSNAGALLLYATGTYKTHYSTSRWTRTGGTPIPRASARVHSHARALRRAHVRKRSGRAYAESVDSLFHTPPLRRELRASSRHHRMRTVIRRPRG